MVFRTLSKLIDPASSRDTVRQSSGFSRELPARVDDVLVSGAPHCVERLELAKDVRFGSDKYEVLPARRFAVAGFRFPRLLLGGIGAKEKMLLASSLAVRNHADF